MLNKILSTLLVCSTVVSNLFSYFKRHIVSIDLNNNKVIELIHYDIFLIL